MFCLLSVAVEGPPSEEFGHPGAQALGPRSQRLPLPHAGDQVGMGMIMGELCVPMEKNMYYYPNSTPVMIFSLKE